MRDLIEGKSKYFKENQVFYITFTKEKSPV